MIIRTNYFPINNIPKFKCPTCGQGQLKKMPNAEIKKHPAWIKNLPDSDTYEYMDESDNIVEGYQLSKSHVLNNENEEYVITFFLECDVSNCQEVVAVSGMSVTEEKGDGVTYMDWVENVYPKSFTPTVNLFEILSNVPEIVKTEIEKSFELFWISPSASANALRTSVERLMDVQHVKKMEKLGPRIVEFEKNHKEPATLLLAIKWIGNDGSHGSNLDCYDVLDAYGFMEECLSQLFGENVKDKLIKLASKINKEREEQRKEEKEKEKEKESQIAKALQAITQNLPNDRIIKISGLTEEEIEQLRKDTPSV